MTQAEARRAELPLPVNHLRALAAFSNRPPVNRREFMKLGAAAVGGGLGAAGCARPDGETRAPSTLSLDHEVALAAIEAARAAGASYADARVSRHASESVSTREGQITGVSHSASAGLGVRALVGGSWGFAGRREVTPRAAAEAAREAVAIAAANDRVAPASVELAPVATFSNVRWATPHEIDPLGVPIEEKAELLFRANAEALKVPGTRFVSSGVVSVKEKRVVATSEGSLIEQHFVRVSPDMTITAVDDRAGDYESRGAVAEPAGRGWEYIVGLDLPGQAARWAEEAVAKLKAPRIDPGRWDLILHPSHLWLTIHESIGHPTELDRALGYEANYAGTSFLAPPAEVLGKVRLGPEFMNFVGNRTEEGGCATVGWDDEGVPAESWPIIKDGIFVDYQTTRDQVAWIAPYTGVTRSHGCAYAQTWADIPFQRMPNVSLMPGREDLTEDDVLAAVDRGVLIEGRGSYSIDQQRYNFQFGGQVFWEIRGGRRVRMLRDVAYVARTPEFWNSLAVLGGPRTYYLGASFGDAKGQPGQSNAVSHGCPIAVFRDVQLLNTA